MAAGDDGAYGFSVRDLGSNNEVDLSKYKGSVSLIVNVASKSGQTDTNYKQLQALYEKLKGRGFNVLAFPCNQLGGREPGTAKEIRKFLDGYGVTFPTFAKIEFNGTNMNPLDFNGPNMHPLYKYLQEQKGEMLGNFTKFLVGPDGTVVKRYGPQTSPASIEADIVALLPA